MAYLLDTDTCIYVLKNANPQLIAKFNNHEGALATSAIVLHELYYGAEGYIEAGKRYSLIDQLAHRLRILPFDQAIASTAGVLRYSLRKSGQQIGPYDILIAATALAHDLTLVTGNQREFSRIKDLKTENWMS